MLQVNDPKIRELLLGGEFGLERESLRVTRDGYFSHTPHPFGEDENIVRDFCENQIEINTGVSSSAREAVAELERHGRRVERRLLEMEEPEYLWPFSNPPYIRGEEDIPVAQFTGELRDKTHYRDYLSGVYGKYKMTLSGIHVNFSFPEELLERDFELSGEDDFSAYRNRVYLKLAGGMVLYGWLITALLAASPLSDSSFVRRGETGRDQFLGMSSVRCGELGYWNHFVPVLSYESVPAYVQSIQKLIDRKLIISQTELYYPVRLKPKGPNSLDTLLERGVNHIELRNVDLNPFAPAGIEVRDLEFIQLLILYAVTRSEYELTEAMQVRAVQNFKNAAHLDIDSTKIFLPGGSAESVRSAALGILGEMGLFFNSLGLDVEGTLGYQREKLTGPDGTYAERVMREFSGNYVEKGMRLCVASS